MNNQQTHFGFKTIDAREKASRIEELFRDVSPHYDRMNDAMSFGLHRLWKDKFVGAIKLVDGGTYLDLATGTGDIILRLLKKAKLHKANLNVIGLDLTAEMMQPARDRLLNRGIADPVTWIQGNAEALPFPDQSVDCVTISFGLRNVTHIEKALCEIHRVLKPEGMFHCLEFSRVYVKPLRDLYQLYAFKLIPKIGDRIAKNQDAYQYLVESIENFPKQETLAAMMREAGFSNINFKNMNFGLVAHHWGRK